MSAPSVKEVLALSRRIDECEKRRAAAAEEKAQLTAQLEALLGIEVCPVPTEPAPALGILAMPSEQRPRGRKMPAIQEQSETESQP